MEQKLLVAGFWYEDGKVLLVKRVPGGRYSEHWEMPGGRVEFGEHPNVAMPRESREELGLNCKLGRCFPTYSQVVDEIQYVQLAYFISPDGDKKDIRLNPEEHTEHKSVTREELSTLLIDPNELSAIEQGFDLAELLCCDR